MITHIATTNLAQSHCHNLLHNKIAKLQHHPITIIHSNTQNLVRKRLLLAMI